MTGASSGLGAAVARRLLGQGHRVVGVARRSDKLKEIKGIHPVVGDVRSESTLIEVKDVVGVHGLSGLFLNAGNTWPIVRNEHMSKAEYEEAVGVSLISPAWWIAQLLPELRQANGSVIYTSSSAVKTPLPAWGLFSSIRAGMHQVLASLAKEEPSITAMAIEPGVMNTDAYKTAMSGITKEMPKEYLKWFEGLERSGKLLDPKGPAETIAKLLVAPPKAKSGCSYSWNEPWINS